MTRSRRRRVQPKGNHRAPSFLRSLDLNSTVGPLPHETGFFVPQLNLDLALLRRDRKRHHNYGVKTRSTLPEN